MRQSAARERPQDSASRALRAALAPLGLREADFGELTAIRALAAELISPNVAGEQALRALYGRTGYGFYIAREGGRVAGLIALAMLNRAGVAAVADETFNALDPSLAHVIGREEKPAAVYGWGIAAATRECAALVVQGGWAVLDALPDQPFFARAATDAGRRLLMEKMSFSPYPGSTSGLLWWQGGRATRRAA